LIKVRNQGSDLWRRMILLDKFRQRKLHT
jgi:hypothetical protein